MNFGENEWRSGRTVTDDRTDDDDDDDDHNLMTMTTPDKIAGTRLPPVKNPYEIVPLFIAESSSSSPFNLFTYKTVHKHCTSSTWDNDSPNKVPKILCHKYLVRTQNGSKRSTELWLIFGSDM